MVLAISIYFLTTSIFEKSNNDKFNFRNFAIKLPTDWQKIEFNGMDSYVGGITNGMDSLTFDYGLYSYSLNEENKENQLFATDTINGKIAYLTKPKTNGNGTIGIYIEEAFKDNRFNLIGKNIKNEELILNIFKSLKFKDSDTLMNSKRINFSEKNK